MKKQEQVMESLTATSTLQACASESAKACKEAAIGSVAIAHYVLRFGDLPLWMQGDPLIQRGYRRQSDSFRACFWSLFYSHNELINVWSHLLPGIFFLGLLLTADYSALLGGVEISVGDRLMIQIYVAGVAGCLFLSVSCPYPDPFFFLFFPMNTHPISAIYHKLDSYCQLTKIPIPQAFFHSTNAHSEKIARRFLKLDYLGIVLNISVTNISSTYFGLRGKSHLQFFYIMLSIFCAVEVFQALRKPHVDGPGAACWRFAPFSPPPSLAASNIYINRYIYISQDQVKEMLGCWVLTQAFFDRQSRNVDSARPQWLCTYSPHGRDRGRRTGPPALPARSYHHRLSLLCHGNNVLRHAHTGTLLARQI